MYVCAGGYGCGCVRVYIYLTPIMRFFRLATKVKTMKYIYHKVVVVVIMVFPLSQTTGWFVILVVFKTPAQIKFAETKFSFVFTLFCFLLKAERERVML